MARQIPAWGTARRSIASKIPAWGTGRRSTAPKIPAWGTVRRSTAPKIPASGYARRLESRLQRPKVRLRGLRPRHRCVAADIVACEAAISVAGRYGGLKPAAGTAGSPPSRTAYRAIVPGAGTLPREYRGMRRRSLAASWLSLPCSSGEGQAPSGARERASRTAYRATVPGAGTLPREYRGMRRRSLAASSLSLPCSSGEGQAPSGARERAPRRRRTA